MVDTYGIRSYCIHNSTFVQLSVGSQRKEAREMNAIDALTPDTFTDALQRAGSP